jgi:hypothetical protein
MYPVSQLRKRLLRRGLATTDLELVGLMDLAREPTYYQHDQMLATN